MGTKESITNYLIEVKNSIENKVLGEITLSQELNFSLEEDEKAAIYMVNMEGAKNERTIFLAFLTREKFFYDKPYDKTSIMYLLMRFLGDLCGDIILLYDKQI